MTHGFSWLLLPLQLRLSLNGFSAFILSAFLASNVLCYHHRKQVNVTFLIKAATI